MTSIVEFVKRNDKRIYYLFNKKMHCRPLDLALRRVTKLFDPIVATLMMIIIFIVSEFNQHPVGVHLVLLVAMTQLIAHTIKRIVNRKRPFETLPDVLFFLKPPKDVYSFPSGHTCGAFTFMLVLSRYFPSFFVVMSVLAVLVGISRIYLGFHYPTDVIVGGILSYIMFITTLTFFV